MAKHRCISQPPASGNPIRIVRVADVFVRSALYPFVNQYRIEGSGKFVDIPGRGSMEIDFAGTPVASLRQIATRLGREQGRPVVDETKPPRRGR